MIASETLVPHSIGIALIIIVLLDLVYSGGPTLAVDRIIPTEIGGFLALAAALALAGEPAFRKAALTGSK